MSFAPQTRWSDVYISATSRFLAGAAMFTVSVTLLLMLQSSGLGGLAVSALILSSTLPLVVLSPITGRLADRYDSRLLILISGLLQAVATLGLIFAEGLVALLALSMLAACGTALVQPVMGALLPVMATKDDLAKAAAVGQTGSLVGMMAGPALAGFLVGELGVTAALAVAVGMSLLRTLSAMAIRSRRGGEQIVINGEVKPKSVAGAWRLRDDRLLAAMVIGLAAVIGILSAANVIEVFLIRESFGASESMYGMINATWMAGMAVGAWIAAMVIQRTKHDGQLAYLLFGMLAISSTVMIAGGGLIYTVELLIPLYLVGGAANAGENSAVSVAIARRVPIELQGRAIAKESAILNGTTMIGFVGGGLALEYFGAREIFVVLGIGGLISLLVCLPMVLRAARSVAIEKSKADTVATENATANDSTAEVGSDAHIGFTAAPGDAVVPVAEDTAEPDDSPGSGRVLTRV
ncbi:putative MFS family arabinose efflux permease [Stackebrandtia endophytica]|uniref:Putative MFS family arabinose efflux permease n=1 Tax=Stackebrandtia endophytica TaxID=1496996 RepID=A0A543AV32_9ACTN|nr:MFS transporter [Stackebrandtia endophytica]TQL76401.1 putative MFS family arabinose efflux permease [Stackebrandtia endophytica]